MKNLAQFFEELKRRNVYKAATAYAITSWLLIQIANTIAPNLNLPEAVPATITKILIIGFPIALIFAWLYELTPEGFKLTKDSNRTEEHGKKIGRKLNRGIIICLAILVSLLLVDRFFFRGKTLFSDKQTVSIAVLPFANFSPDKENDYMADGLTEQILNELANISGLKVPARTSSFAFKQKNEDIRHIAEQLEVNFILEGSVRFHQDKIRITAQLINAANGFHLWSNTYDENFDEVFDIQESISRKVANELKVRLLPKEEETISTRLTENSEAYKFYLKSREYSQLRDDASLKRAIKLLEQAIDLEPNFAEAHAELSFLYSQRYFYGSLDKDTRDVKSKYHIQKALELAPEKPEVLRSNAAYLRAVEGRAVQDSAMIIQDLRKAVKIKPNYADGHFMLFNALRTAKLPELAHQHLKKTIELDPLNNFFLGQFAANLYHFKKEPEKALQIIERQLERDSTTRSGLLLKAAIFSDAPYGDLVEAFKIRHKALKSNEVNRIILNNAMMGSLQLDLWPLAQKYANTIQIRYSETNALYFNVLYYYQFRRDIEKAEELLDYLIEDQRLIPEEEILEKVNLELLNGNFPNALQQFELGFPLIADGSIFNEKLNYPGANDLALYIDILRLNGHVQKADNYAISLCDFYKNRIENENLSGSIRDQLLLECYFLSDKKTNFLELLEETFFQNKNRSEVFGNIKVGWYMRYEDDPDYQELFKRIEAETHRMRAEVIDYLKKEGDWNESWDVELGLK